jgi:hypothetical protein
MIDINKQFSMINLPSRGKFYKDGKKSLMVKYLTAVEENILSDDMVMESGKGMEMVLKNLVMEDIDINSLVSGDYHSILIFLRATAFGDEVEIKPTCPHCGKEAENSFRLSSLDFKEQKHTPSQDGSYMVELEDIGLSIKVVPMTLGRELHTLKNTTESDYILLKENGFERKVLKSRTLKVAQCIDNINGKSDIETIKKVLNRLKRKQFEDIEEFIMENQTGVQDYIKMNCSYCGSDFKQSTGLGNNFLSLPYEYKEIINEEIFLLTHYGKGFTYNDAMNMPTYLRKWFIRRIDREMREKNEREKSEYNKAKSKSNSKSFR